MSFDCQLKLCRKAEPERFLGLMQIDVLLDTNSKRQARQVYEKTSIGSPSKPASLRQTSVLQVRANASRNWVFASTAIETYFHFPVGTPVADAGVRKKRPFVGIASHRDSRSINAIFDHVAGHPTGARR